MKGKKDALERLAGQLARDAEDAVYEEPQPQGFIAALPIRDYEDINASHFKVRRDADEKDAENHRGAINGVHLEDSILHCFALSGRELCTFFLSQAASPAKFSVGAGE
jgi:hypothetical protein